MRNLRQRFGNVLKNIANEFWGQDPRGPNTVSVIPFPQTQRSRSEANEEARDWNNTVKQLLYLPRGRLSHSRRVKSVRKI